MNKYVNSILKEIKEDVKERQWIYNQIWVENNCIYADVTKRDGKKEIEGLYAGSDFNTNDVYNVYNQLKNILNFKGLLIDDNILY